MWKKLKEKENIIFVIGIVLLTLSMTSLAYTMYERKLEEIKVVEASKVEKVSARGDVNMGSGGSGGDYESGSGNGNNILGNERDEGVRVTLVDTETNTAVSGTTMDFANNPRQPIVTHFGKVNKLNYLNNGESVKTSTSQYDYRTLDYPIPKVVNGSLSALKAYFGSERFAKKYSQLINMKYEDMTSGKYKLMIEPVGYPKIRGKVTACTATELAIFDKQYKLNLSKSWIQTFSHFDLPFSMFLERDEFGIPNSNNIMHVSQKNDVIIRQLGVAAVTFKDAEDKIEAGEYTYRTNTEVYTSLESVPASSVLSGDSKSGYRIRPTTVTFRLSDSSDGARIISQKGRALRSDDKVYVRWITPSVPKEMKVIAEVRYMTSEPYEHPTQGTILREYYKTEVVEIPIKVEEVIENTPPNPVADDRNDSFRYVSTSNASNLKKDKVEENSWREYELEIGSKDIYNSKGEYVRTEYIPLWTKKEYTTRLKIEGGIYPDPLCETYINNGYGSYTMKSGYGIRQRIETRVDTKVLEKREYLDSSGNKKIEERSYNEDAGTGVQGGLSYFSDFNFKEYNRVLEIEEVRGKRELKFKNNRYSTYNNQTHFTPIWYPDDMEYTVYSYVYDSWSPGGQLYGNVEDSIYIKGNLWDDWYVQRLPEDYEIE